MDDVVAGLGFGCGRVGPIQITGERDTCHADK
jgi:hypothetical protein